METIQTEVLIIGGGIAGLLAAIESARAGRSVIVLSSSKVGKSGNTLVSGASISMLGPEAGSDDSPGLFCQDLIRSGNGINDPSNCAHFLTPAVALLEILRNMVSFFTAITDSEWFVNRGDTQSQDTILPISLT